MRSTTVAGRQFDLSRRTIERATSRALPEPVRDHFVIIGGRRWPPKQVLALATGLDRADFTTYQARRILTRLGFPASRARRQTGGGSTPLRPGRRRGAAQGKQGRSGHDPERPQPTDETSTEPPSLVEALRPFIGEWVAVRGDEVLVAAPTPRDVVAWLTEHGQQAQSVFRVPGSEQEVGGAAPL